MMVLLWVFSWSISDLFLGPLTDLFLCPSLTSKTRSKAADGLID